MKGSVICDSALEGSLTQAIKQLHADNFGYLPDKVECRCTNSSDLVVNVERQRSPTEAFLLKSKQTQLAQDVGFSVNRILKDKIFELLVEGFDLPVVELSFFKPSLPEKFGLFIVLRPPS